MPVAALFSRLPGFVRSLADLSYFAAIPQRQAWRHMKK